MLITFLKVHTPYLIQIKQVELIPVNNINLARKVTCAEDLFFVLSNVIE